METPWGALAVSDAHIHFFSHRFFAALAEQKKAPVDSLAPVLGWQIPNEDPKHLADTLVQRCWIYWPAIRARSRSYIAVC
jgi:hypothetical protein